MEFSGILARHWAGIIWPKMPIAFVIISPLINWPLRLLSSSVWFWSFSFRYTVSSFAFAGVAVAVDAEGKANRWTKNGTIAGGKDLRLSLACDTCGCCCRCWGSGGGGGGGYSDYFCFCGCGTFIFSCVFSFSDSSSRFLPWRLLWACY